jgi:hypothetical protein
VRAQLDRPIRVTSYGGTVLGRWLWMWHCRVCQDTSYGHLDMFETYSDAMIHCDSRTRRGGR